MPVIYFISVSADLIGGYRIKECLKLADLGELGFQEIKKTDLEIYLLNFLWTRRSRSIAKKEKNPPHRIPTA